MTEFPQPLRGDDLAEYMSRIKVGDAVSVEVTLEGHVSTITGPCWEYNWDGGRISVYTSEDIAAVYAETLYEGIGRGES